MSEVLRQHIQQVTNITDSEFELITTYFKPIKFRKRQFVIQENQSVNTLYFVEKGLLKSSFIDTTDKEHILQFACENWWISDFMAFFKQTESTTSVECIEDAELLAISYDNLDLLCKEVPKMEHFFRIKGNFGYVALQQRLLSVMTNSTKERYENFCKQYPDVIKRVPKKLIANYLGVSRETLSRLQK